jgi:hypothetical protein
MRRCEWTSSRSIRLMRGLISLKIYEIMLCVVCSLLWVIKFIFWVLHRTAHERRQNLHLFHDHLRLVSVECVHSQIDGVSDSTLKNTRQTWLFITYPKMMSAKTPFASAHSSATARTNLTTSRWSPLVSKIIGEKLRLFSCAGPLYFLFLLSYSARLGRTDRHGLEVTRFYAWAR